MEETLKLAANYGFPMVVAGYLLIRLEPIIKDLQRSINSLTIVVARQAAWRWKKSAGSSIGNMCKKINRFRTTSWNNLSKNRTIKLIRDPLKVKGVVKIFSLYCKKVSRDKNN